MKLSTLAFITAFFALFGLFHRARSAHSICSHSSPVITVRNSAVEYGRSPRVRALEREFASSQQRHQETQRSLKDIDSSLRKLQDMADRVARNGSRRSHDRVNDAITAVEQHTLAQMKDNLEEVRRGRDALIALRDQLELETTTLRARIQLARAGIDPEADPLEPEYEPDRQSPVDALSRTTAFATLKRTVVSR